MVYQTVDQLKGRSAPCTLVSVFYLSLTEMKLTF